MLSSSFAGHRGRVRPPGLLDPLCYGAFGGCEKVVRESGVSFLFAPSLSHFLKNETKTHPTTLSLAYFHLLVLFVHIVQRECPGPEGILFLAQPIEEYRQVVVVVEFFNLGFVHSTRWYRTCETPS